MKKILDFIIIFFLVFFIVNFFSWNKEKQAVVQNNVIVKTTKDSYTIPASVKLLIENNTSSWVVIDTCKDIEINYLGVKKELSKDFCKTIDIKPKETKTIDFSSEYQNFLETGNYIISVKAWDKTYPQAINIENKGIISKIFVYLFYAPAYNLIIILIELFKWSLGWAIIAITILLRLILLWPQHKMLVSQKRLQELQPKIKEIQEKYKWNHQMLWMKTMELYKKEKVNPMGSCGFMLIQMPILLVIYNIILYIKDPSNHYYLYTFLKDFDFNSINYYFYWINLLWKGWTTWIILWVIVAILQFIQIKLSMANNKLSNKWVVLEKKKWASDYSSMMPDPEMMNKVMLYGMPVMVWIFTYQFPAWLGMYWWISTLFMIIQQLVVNKKLKKSS